MVGSNYMREPLSRLSIENVEMSLSSPRKKPTSASRRVIAGSFARPSGPNKNKQRGQKDMNQDSAMKVCDRGADTIAVTGAQHLAGPNWRAQVILAASAHIAKTGLHGTTTLAIAQATGISVPILHVRFGDKRNYSKRLSQSTVEPAFAYLTVIYPRLRRRSRLTDSEHGGSNHDGLPGRCN